MAHDDEEDRRIETHPDLIDPNWQKHAELDAWLGAKKDLKKRRKVRQKAQRRGGGGYRAPGDTRWPGITALLVVVGLVVAAIVAHQIQGHGVNEPDYLTSDYGDAAGPFTTPVVSGNSG